jgi:hypothetical protein
LRDETDLVGVVKETIAEKAKEVADHKRKRRVGPPFTPFGSSYFNTNRLAPW